MKRILVPVVTLSAIMLVPMAGSSAIGPILPQYARAFGVSVTTVGLVLAINNSTRMLCGQGRAHKPRSALGQALRRCRVLGLGLGKVQAGIISLGFLGSVRGVS